MNLTARPCRTPRCCTARAACRHCRPCSTDTCAGIQEVQGKQCEHEAVPRRTQKGAAGEASGAALARSAHAANSNAFLLGLPRSDRDAAGGWPKASIRVLIRRPPFRIGSIMSSRQNRSPIDTSASTPALQDAARQTENRAAICARRLHKVSSQRKFFLFLLSDANKRQTGSRAR